ncbi:AAA family ATPase [Rhodococcus opacus]|uniref:AAA family ATPase n=1 Tax=Rhodococcus opacus TaxID=37919 RepID=A0AAX3YT94_RHOOP|nr:AAA family ATPase [Rhodococcus opacus]MCZ4587651.1 AAA family ATPase [Rhodococcus opacus]WLF51353.1 AAA family ATPase [Rhodococcus opacus]
MQILNLPTDHACPECNTGQKNGVGLTRGLPGSGKSSLARLWVQQDPEHRVRINRDDLRAELFAVEGELTDDQETVVTLTQRARTAAALREGRSVVCDDTLLDPLHLAAWKEFLAPFGVPVIVVDVPTPVDECIRRDRERGAKGGRQVGAEVIRMLAARYEYPGAQC